MTDASAARDRVGAIASAIADRRGDLIVALRELVVASEDLSGVDATDDDVLFLVAIEANLDEVPVGAVRDRWDPTALDALDRSTDDYLAAVRDQMTAAAARLSARWGTPWLACLDFGDVHDARSGAHELVVPAGITSTDDLFATLFEVLAVPGDFGFHWASLRDCLRDLHWLGPGPIVIRHVDVPQLPPPDLRTYLEVLVDAVRSWQPGWSPSLRVSFPSSARDTLSEARTNYPRG